MAEHGTADVSTPIGDYKDMAARFALPVALLGGTLTMRDEATVYMPKYPEEEEARYLRRLNSAVLLESYRKAVENLSARPFRKPVKLDENAGDFWRSFARNVDLSGTSLTSFARTQLQDLLVFGKSHILVDYPDTGSLKERLGVDQLTLADEQKYNLRPYMSHISPSAVIGWLSERRGGIEVLTQLRIKEVFSERVNEWEEREVQRIHVWTEKEITTYRKNGNDDSDEFFLEGEPRTNTIGFIPLITVYANRQSFLKSFPPLEGLAHLNQKHWWMQSDQDQIETVARVPMLFFRGFSVEDLQGVEVGPYKIFGNRAHESDIKVVETNGKAVEVGSHALMRLEKQMQAMSMEPLVRKPQQLTATEVAYDEVRSLSDLEAYVTRLEWGLFDALSIVALWRKDRYVPEISIGEDEQLFLNGDRELEELRLDYQMGAITQRTYLKHRRERGLYSEDLDIDEEIAETQMEEGLSIDTGNTESPDD